MTNTGLGKGIGEALKDVLQEPEQGEITANDDPETLEAIRQIYNYRGPHIVKLEWEGEYCTEPGKLSDLRDPRAFPPDHGPLAAMGEIAPSGNRDFKYVFVVPEGVQMTDGQFVILEDSNNLKYLNLV